MLEYTISLDDIRSYLSTLAEDEAMDWMKTWYEENYSGGWNQWGEDYSVEEITIKKGVTKL